MLLSGCVTATGVPVRGREAPPATGNQDRQAGWAQLNAGVEEAYLAGTYDRAAEIATRALALAESSFGPRHPNTLTSIDVYALVLDALGRYAESLPLHIRAVEGRTRVLGRNHQLTLESVGNFAIWYGEQGRYREGEPLYMRAVEGNERVLGPDHQQTLTSINNLAWLYMSQGRYADAEPLHVRALEASERTLGRDHSDTLGSVNNLAYLYRLQGRYAESEPLYARAVAANDRVLGAEHPQTLVSLHNLADLYVAQGRHADAEPLELRVLEARERLLGREHPLTLTTVNNLAVLYVAQRRFADAEPLYLRLLDARQRVIGAEHPHTLATIGNLAYLYGVLGRHAESRPLYARALAASERTLGRDHPQTLETIEELADQYEGQRRHAEAEPLYVRVLAARTRILGRAHPDTISVAAKLALLRLSAGASGAAIEPARFAVSAIRTRRAAASTGTFAEAQRGREEFQRSVSFALLADAGWAAAQTDSANRAALTAESFAALQDATAGTTSRAVVQMAVRRMADNTNMELGALVRERESLNTQWAANNAGYSAALGESGAAAEARRRTLPAERERIEARMAEVDATLRREFPQYFALTRPEPMSISATQALLAPDEAILMVVPTQFGTHVMAVSRTSIEWVRSEWTRERIDAAVQRLLWDVGANVGVTPAQRDEWQRRAGPGYPYDRTTAHNLYRQIVAPVAGVLGGKRHVFIAAGGSLTSLPFGILVSEPPQGADGDPRALREQTRWFADAHALIQIPSIQSLQFLRRFGGGRAGANRPLAFVGFGDPALQGPPAARGRARGNTGVALASLFEPGRTRSGGSVASLRQLRLMSRLPGTAIELENIRVALGAPRDALFLAERATEANVRTSNLSNARILVFATHGLTGGELWGVAEPGLVFTPPQNPSEADDGLLTASEVSALRLNADWVILSACNTAAGDGTEGAPGLSGLSRAFFYAGARNLLASHWPVGDDVAARLTVRTIQLLHERPGLSRAEALQLAMREVRNDSAHDSPDDSWAHPSAWAPFTLIGDWVR